MGVLSPPVSALSRCALSSTNEPSHEPSHEPSQRGERLLDPVEAWLLNELSQGRSAELKALGASMRPWIRSGDRLSLTPCVPSEVRVGGVYAFVDLTRSEGERLSPLHRVMWVNEGWVYCKGDSLPRLDPRAQQGAVLARVSLAPLSVTREERFTRMKRLSFCVRAQGVSGALWPLALLTSLSYSVLSFLSRPLRR